MTRKIIRRAASFAILSAIGVVGSVLISGQAPASTSKRTYVWWAELVSLDENAKTVTAKAPVEAAVTTYLSTKFKPGDKIVLTWNANPGKPDTGPVFYVEQYDVMKRSKVDVGYILPVEFVAADTAAKTLTFKATIPDSALATLKSITAGQWFKGTSPMSQPAETAMIASIESSPKPSPFVRMRPDAPTVTQPVTKISTPEDYDKAMKTIGAAFRATNQAILSGTKQDARAELAGAYLTMMAVQAFWVDQKKDDPAAIAKEALAKMQSLDKALADTDDEEHRVDSEVAAKALGGVCASCHAKYREQDPATKAFRMKPGTL